MFTYINFTKIDKNKRIDERTISINLETNAIGMSFFRIGPYLGHTDTFNSCFYETIKEEPKINKRFFEFFNKANYRSVWLSNSKNGVLKDK